MQGGGIIGIDPGKTGGVALVESDQWGNPVMVAAIKMPETCSDLQKLLEELTQRSGVAYIEKVHSMPGQGVSSTFTFGRWLGRVEQAAIAACLRVEWVAPGVWQRAMGCLSGGDKRVTRNRASEVFPAAKVTHAIADALLISEYGRRKEAGRE